MTRINIVILSLGGLAVCGLVWSVFSPNAAQAALSSTQVGKMSIRMGMWAVQSPAPVSEPKSAPVPEPIPVAPAPVKPQPVAQPVAEPVESHPAPEVVSTPVAPAPAPRARARVNPPDSDSDPDQASKVPDEPVQPPNTSGSPSVCKGADDAKRPCHHH